MKKISLIVIAAVMMVSCVTFSFNAGPVVISHDGNSTEISLIRDGFVYYCGRIMKPLGQIRSIVPHPSEASVEVDGVTYKCSIRKD